MTNTIILEPDAGAFAENKDEARKLRQKQILPALARNEQIVLDFSKVDYATQSYVHALIGEALTRYGEAALEQIEFRNCSDQMRSLVELVVDYSLGGFGESGRLDSTEARA